MSGDWRPRPERPRKKVAPPAIRPDPPAPPPAPEWWPLGVVAPAGKFRVVSFGCVNFEEPTSILVGDFDLLPLAKQCAMDLNRAAVLHTTGAIRSCWVFNAAGGCELNPYAGFVLHRRPLAVTSIVGLQREESKKPVTSHKRTK